MSCGDPPIFDLAAGYLGPAGGTWQQDLGLCGRISPLIEISLTSDDFTELLEGEGDPWLLSIVHNEGGSITP